MFLHYVNVETVALMSKVETYGCRKPSIQAACEILRLNSEHYNKNCA